MKKITMIALLIFILIGCSNQEKFNDGSFLENKVEASEKIEFKYQYKIIDKGLFGKNSPSVAVVIKNGDYLHAVEIRDEVPIYVSYENLVGSVLYSTSEITNSYTDYERVLKIESE